MRSLLWGAAYMAQLNPAPARVFRMSEAGCTDEEMMAVLGHRSATSLRIYTKGAEQRRLAENAITKLEQNRHKASPTRGFKFWGIAEKRKGYRHIGNRVALPSGIEPLSPP